MQRTRRQFLVTASGFAAANLGRPFQSFGRNPRDSRTRLILLGTKGGPRVSPGRSNPSILILVNNTPYLIDCGYGTSRQLIAAGVPPEKLRYILITHHHSDHDLEFGPLIYNAWAAGSTARIDAYGPPGLVRMIGAFFNYLEFDIRTRIADEGRPDPRRLIVSHEISRPGVVLRNRDVTITCTRVHHPPITQSYAYRFDAPDRSIVISGDTAYSPELIKLAKGADVLVHEVMYLPGVEALLQRVGNAARLRQHLLQSHTSTEDAGKVAAQAGVKTLVLSHFVPGDDPSITDEMWAEGARKHFGGRVVVGKDLLEI
jgi:ribonuclease BN (tRNA processing enzyme)